MQAPTTRWSGAAITSFVFSLLWLWGIGSLVAVIVGHCAQSECRTTGKQGTGLAIWGTVLGYVGVVVTILMVIGLASASDDSDTYVPSYYPSYSSSYGGSSTYGY